MDRPLLWLLFFLSFGFSAGVPSVEQSASYAADVAVVEILSEEPLTFEYGSSWFVCGCRYRSQVVTSFKGAEGAIDFGSARCLPSHEPHRKYLVFTGLNRRDIVDKYLSRPLLPWETELDRARQACLLNGSEKLVMAGQPDLAAFHGEDNDWLVVDRNSVISIGPYRRRQEIVNGRVVDLARWADVRAEIERVLAAGHASP